MNLLLAFAPFFAFAFLERTLGTHNALLAATAISGALILRETVLQKKSLKPLEATSLLLFGALTVLAKRPEFHLSVIGVRLIVDAGLLAVAFLSVLIGKPFTLAYARDEVSAETAASRTFHLLNMTMSSLWSLAFAVVVAADAAMLYWPGFTAMDGTLTIAGAVGAGALLSTVLPRFFAAKAYA